jgi:hypothetical protein
LSEPLSERVQRKIQGTPPKVSTPKCGTPSQVQAGRKLHQCATNLARCGTGKSRELGASSSSSTAAVFLAQALVVRAVKHLNKFAISSQLPGTDSFEVVPDESERNKSKNYHRKRVFFVSDRHIHHPESSQRRNAKECHKCEQNNWVAIRRLPSGNQEH